MGMFAVLLLACVVMYFAFPDTANKLILSGQIGMGKLLNKVGIGGGDNGTAPDPGPQQAHFTNIDGNVRVRKASTNAWVVADYSLALERGDVVQTGPCSSQVAQRNAPQRMCDPGFRHCGGTTARGPLVTARETTPARAGRAWSAASVGACRPPSRWWSAR